MTQVIQYRIRVLRTRAEIESLREFWNSCSPSRDADLDFYLFIVALYPEALRPHVVVLYEADVPKVLLAGRLDEGRVPVKAGYVSLSVPKMRILRFVHGGCLGDVCDATAKLLVGSIIDSLAASEADAGMLEHIDPSSPLARYACSMPSWVCSDHLIYPEFHRIRDVSGKTGAFLTCLSGNERYQHRKRARRLAEDFRSCSIELFSTPDEVDRLMRDTESVAKKSYQRGLGVGFSETPIIRSRLEFEAQKGWLRAYVLYLDDQPSAFWIGSLRNRVFLSDYLAFDPAYAKYGPGLYLIVKVIEELCGDPHAGSVLVERIDFGIGDASYKERLSNRHYQESPVYIFGPSIKAVWVNALRSTVGLMNRLAKGLMGMTPLAGRIKRIWRARMTESR